jgi:hypothetical protein
VPQALSSLSPDLLLCRSFANLENKQKQNVRKLNNNKKRDLFPLLSLFSSSFNFSLDFSVSLHVSLCALFRLLNLTPALVLCVCVILHRKLADTRFPLEERGTARNNRARRDTCDAQQWLPKPSSRFYRKLTTNNICVIL